MIDIAKKRTPDDLPIEYQHGNCEDLNMLEDKSFDLIISNMVMQDLADYEKAFQEMHLAADRPRIFYFFNFASLLHYAGKRLGKNKRRKKTALECRSVFL
jgi:hypothetical protein